MARTTQQIFDSMVAEGIAKATADGNADALAMFANTSKVAIWRLLFYIMAFAIMSFEKLLDAFKNVIIPFLPEHPNASTASDKDHVEKKRRQFDRFFSKIASRKEFHGNNDLKNFYDLDEKYNKNAKYLKEFK